VNRSFGSVAVLLVVLGTGSCSGGIAHVAGLAPVSSGVVPSGDLTGRQRAVALNAAHTEATKAAKQAADVTGWPRDIASVSAVREERIVTDSNTGHECTSGSVVVIKLIGSFPHIVVSSPPGASSTAVHAVIATADLRSGLVCLVSVETGKVTPGPNATVLFTR
jgi:hypothetical protein